MSPSKQKANDKKGARDQKVSTRQAPVSGSTGASAYNPLSGTFHTLQPISLDSGTGNTNGRFRSIDDVDDNASSTGVAADVECTSNNGSCSGESEDQSNVNGKEKPGGGKLGVPPGLVGALDKRDKIRGKNERKHQRQKERRAQELRDKCTGYLMSRKLEALSQQLVAMGFSQERATMALILNDGHVEQSVAWLLEGGESQLHEDWNTGGNPKIDISEELGQITKIEKMYKCTRPEIERAVVSCEGDLCKALECLRVRSWNTSPGEMDDENGGSKDAAGNLKTEAPLSALVMPHSSRGTQTRIHGTLQPTYPSRREDQDLIINKGRLQGSSRTFQTSPEGSGKGSSYARNPPTPSTTLQRSLSPANQRGYIQSSRPPSSPQTAPFPSVSPHIHGVDFRMDASFLFANNGTDSKMINAPTRDFILNSSSKEPAFTAQPPQLLCTGSQPTPDTSTLPPVLSSPMFLPSSWSHGLMDVGSSSSALYGNLADGDVSLKGLSLASKLAENLTACGTDMQGHYYPLESTQSDSLGPHWTPVGSRLSSVDPHIPSLDRMSSAGHSVGSRLSSIDPHIPSSDLMSSAGHSRSSSSTSYGIYPGWGSGLSGSSVDWNASSMVNCDYKNIDWSMTASPTTEAGCLWGLSSNTTSLKLQEDGHSGQDLEEERRFQAISGTANLLRDSSKGLSVWKTTPPDLGVQDKTSSEPGNTVALGGHEWTSPFAGKDLFTLSHVVYSPSL